MKMQALFEKVSQVFTMTLARNDDLVYSFVLRLVGHDGLDKPVYFGDCNVHDSGDDSNNRMKCAVVMRKNGTLYAAHYVDVENAEQAVTAAGMAIATQRKAYGVGHFDPAENWVTYRENEVEVDGYDASID